MVNISKSQKIDFPLYFQKVIIYVVIIYVVIIYVGATAANLGITSQGEESSRALQANMNCADSVRLPVLLSVMTAESSIVLLVLLVMQRPIGLAIFHFISYIG